MIYILNKQQQIISTLSNKGDRNKIVPYFEDIHIEELDTGVETFEFKTLSNTEVANDIQVGNYVAFKDEDCYKIFQIKEVQEHHTEQIEKSVYCEGACLELLNEVVRPIIINSANLKQFLNTVLDGTSWSVGMIDSSLNEVIHLDISDYKNVYKVIQDTVIETFGGELRFRVEIENNRIISKNIDVFAKRGRVTNHRFEYGVNMTSVEKVVDTSELVTALIGVGKDDLTFKDVEANDKPKNQDFIANEDAYNRWNNNGSHIMGVFNCESESAQELLKLTRDELQRRSEPKITYNLEVELLGANVSLGDEVFVIDNEFNPPLHLSARVSKLEKSKTDKQSNRCTLSNFKEVKSNITSEMRALASSLDGKVDDKINKKFPVASEDIKDGAITQGKIEQQYLENIKSDIVQAGIVETEKLVANKADISDLNATNATISNLQANKADITELNTVKGNIDNLTSEVADINTLVNGNLTSENIHSLVLSSDKVTVEDAFIKNAMIDEIDANKIKAGEINTGVVSISSPTGGIVIENNTQQFKDRNNKVRVQIGEDRNGDFNFSVYDETGNGVLIDHTGVKEGALAENIIKESMISQDAVGEKQINYNSFATGFNKDENTNILKATKIKLDNQNQSLEVGFNSLKTQADNTKNKTESNTTMLNVQQGLIQGLISDTTIEKDGKSIKIKDDYNSTVQTIDSMKSTIGSHTSQIDGLNSTVSTQGSSISQLKNQIALKVEQTDITNAINNVQIGGRNLIIKNNLTNGWVQSDGVVANNNAYRVTEYIPCSEGETFIFQMWMPNSVQVWYDDTYFDANKVYINSYNSNYITNTYFYKVLVAPTNAKYIRISFTYNENYKYKLERGTKPTDYTPAPEDIDSNISAIDEKITTTSNKVASIETNLSSITSRVGSVETKATTLEKTTQKILINNFSRSGNLDGWSIGSATSKTIVSSNVVGNYLNVTTNSNSLIASDYFEIDPSKTYKISLMQQFPTDNGTSSFYFGVYAYDKDKNSIGVYLNTSTSLNSNPYFYSSGKTTGGTGTWVTYNGYIYGQDVQVNTGTPKGNCQNFMKFDAKTKYLKVRFLHYRGGTYGDGLVGSMYFAHPTISEVDSQIVNTETRLNTAEQKITDSAIVSTVTNSTTYKNALSGKVDTTKIISTINQTAEAVKINASKIQLEGCVTAGDSDSNYIQIENANYTVRDSGAPKAFFGFRKMGQNGYDNYVVPKLAMGAYGYNLTHNYFTIVPYRGTDNPQGTKNAYVDIAYHCLSPGDYSNIKMYDGGDIRLAPVRNLEICTNYVDTVYNSTNERRMALFSTSGYNWLGVHLQTGGISNHSNGYGLILSDRYRSDSWDGTQTGGGSKITSVRVNTDSSGNKFFRPTYTSGDIDLGSGSFRWKTVYAVNGLNTSSDRTLKENIEYIEDVPNKKATINLSVDSVTTKDMYNFVKDDLFLAKYNFIGDNKSNTKFGFIAQDIVDTKVGNEIITADYNESEEDKSDIKLGFDLNNYVNVLAGALKVAIQEIEELKNKISEMEKKIV